jgi:N-acetylmuramoyl-L-alanine amidase
MQKTPRQPSPFSTWRTLQTVIIVAVIVATMFTIWTPKSLFSFDLKEKIAAAFENTPLSPTEVGTPADTPTPRATPPIGIVAGHWGNDSGAVCADGFTEAELNLKIATLVKQQLQAEGFEVDLLKEFDPRQSGYLALALVSIHNDSCDYVNDEATGFKVAAAASFSEDQRSQYLAECLIDRYGKLTNLKFHYNSITLDMEAYHTFYEIHHETPAAIIETGFLNLDRQILTENTDLIAQGVTAGIMCFLRNEPVQIEPSPIP